MIVIENVGHTPSRVRVDCDFFLKAHDILFRGRGSGKSPFFALTCINLPEGSFAMCVNQVTNQIRDNVRPDT